MLLDVYVESIVFRQGPSYELVKEPLLVCLTLLSRPFHRQPLSSFFSDPALLPLSLLPFCDFRAFVLPLRLTRLPEQWMERLMAKASSPGQGVDDLVRRSAGMPAAFLALFEAEPEGAPKRLLKKAMPWLLSWARGEPPAKPNAGGESEAPGNSFPEGKENGQEGAEKEPEVGGRSAGGVARSRGEERGVTEGNKVPGGDAPGGSEGGKKAVGGRQRVVKAALEGMVPQVHAFNTLRVTFGNTNLGTDTSGYAAEGLMVAVRGFASPHWEVGSFPWEHIFLQQLP